MDGGEEGMALYGGGLMEKKTHRGGEGSWR
jgi:hypothetical protein